MHLASRVNHPELQDDIRQVLKTLAPMDREVSASEGGLRYLARIRPYRSVDNFIAGAVVTYLDVTAVARAEAAESRFQTVFDLSVVGQTQGDPTTMKFTAVNRKFCEMLGYEPEELLGMSAFDITPVEDQQPTRDWWERLRAGESPELHLDKRMFKKDGSIIWTRVTANIIRGPDGASIGTSAIVIDITEARAAEARQKLLLGELQHRVRNTLALIRSLVHRTAGASETVEGFATTLDGRIAAFARTQAVVTRDPAAGVDLRQMLVEEIRALGQGEDQVTMKGPGVRLQARAAETVGLALHELATNALKYGALKDGKGSVAVTWRTTRGDRPMLMLEWRETLTDRRVEPPVSRGFGSELLEHGLAFELGARTTLAFPTGGVRFSLDAPLDRLVIG